MRVGNAAILIVVGIILLWVIVSGKGSCIGGAFACMASGGGNAPASPWNALNNLPNVQAPGTTVSVKL